MPNKCRKVGEKLVCGALRGGGTVPKSGGVFRLHKGEKIFTPSQLKQMAKKKPTKKKAGRKKKACKCKHK